MELLLTSKNNPRSVIYNFGNFFLFFKRGERNYSIVKVFLYDMVVRESIQITESAVKLAGLGAKNLAALLVAVAKDNPKLSGKTGLKRLIQDGEELAIFSVKQEDLRGFQMESKRYGVLFYPIINRVEKTGTVEIMAKAKDARQINRIFERMGYPAPVREDDTAKKANPRVRSENSFRERGNGARTSTEMDKPSVRAKMLELKKVSEQMARQARTIAAPEHEQR